MNKVVMHKLVLIERYSKKDCFWENLIKFNRTGLNVEEVVHKYCGFEGEMLICSTFDTNEAQALYQIYEEKNSFENDLILHLFTESSSMPEKQKKKANYVGYDVGVCEEEKTVFSSIFNEVLFGNLQELVDYYECLNEHLLFPTRNLALEYLKMHDELSDNNMGVEDYEKMNIYEAWIHTR